MKIGLVARFDNQWAAGKYYIENILCALQRHPNQCKIIILTEDGSAINWSEKISSPETLTYAPLEPKYSIIQRILNTIWRSVCKKNAIEKRISHANIDVVFPLGKTDEYPFEIIDAKAFWIPDFQEKHFPGNFSKEELALRAAERTKIAKQSAPLVLSSRAAKADFLKFFSPTTCKTMVLPFAVYNSIPKHLNQDQVLEKFKVKKRAYFICPNQFWKHKNQMVIIRAAALIQKLMPELSFKILFTGKESGFKGEGLAEECKKACEEFNLSAKIQFLGFIDRTELLILIKNASALLQSSLFEGWNTSIEDAKSLNSPIIASALDVHKEQLPNQILLDPHDESIWANAMIEQLLNHKEASFNYEQEQARFEHLLLRTMHDIADS